jgi:tetratricopeptide (TPR) repeat protein
LPYPDVSEVHGFSPDSRWLYVGGKENRRLDVASLARTPPRPVPLAADRDLPPWQKEWRSERARVGGTFSPDNHLAAFGRNDGSIQLVLVDKEDEIAQLFSPELGRIYPSSFSPDGALLLAAGEETGALYVFDLRRIRTQLAELGLDWKAPAYPAARPEETNPVLAPPLEVELLGAEHATSADKMADQESQQAAAALLWAPCDPEAHYRLGTRLLDAGEPERAHAHLATALAFRPELHEALYPRGLAAFRRKRWAEAVADATRCLENCPFHHSARYLRAEANRMQNQHEKAVADYTAWIAAYPRVVRGYEMRALCYDALGRPNLAKADRERALKLGGPQSSKK